MARDIKLEIDGKLHKLISSNRLVGCAQCSLKEFCETFTRVDPCPAYTLGSDYFVELKVEK